MSDDTPFVNEPSDSREAIMHATFCALQEHGYAGLSIQRIADQSDLSKSTFYHHFDGKDDLLLSFMDYILAEFTRIYSLEADSDPVADLHTYLEMGLGDFPDDEIEVQDKQQMLGAYVELRAQAVQNEAYREKVTETEEGFKRQLIDLIEDGIEQGVFRDVDVERTAAMLGTIVEGAAFRQATRTDDPTETVREELDAYIQQRLLADGS